MPQRKDLPWMLEKPLEKPQEKPNLSTIQFCKEPIFPDTKPLRVNRRESFYISPPKSLVARKIQISTLPKIPEETVVEILDSLDESLDESQECSSEFCSSSFNASYSRDSVLYDPKDRGCLREGLRVRRVRHPYWIHDGTAKNFGITYFKEDARNQIETPQKVRIQLRKSGLKKPLGTTMIDITRKSTYRKSTYCKKSDI